MSKIPPLPHSPIKIPLPKLEVDPLIARPRQNKIARQLSQAKRLSLNDKNVPRVLLSSMKHSKATRSSADNYSLPIPDNEYDIIIHLISNYGDPNMITLSEIDVIEKNHLPAHNVTITADKKRYSRGNLSFLCNNSILKSSRDKMWAEEWSQDSDPIVLHIHFRSFTPPEYLRIFNSRAGDKSNLKDFAIFFGGAFIVSGVVPIDFGVTISLKNYNIPALDMSQELEYACKSTSRDGDKYGIIPIYDVKDIELVILSAFKSEELFGLNSVEFFGALGDPIPYTFVESIDIYGGNNLSTPYKLFKLKKRTMRMNDMWIGRREELNKPVTLKISLKEPLKISMIRIWNYNGADESDILGVKNLKVIINQKTCVWVGKLNRAKGTTSLIKDGVNDIYLSENYKIKENPNIADIDTTRRDD